MNFIFAHKIAEICNALHFCKLRDHLQAALNTHSTATFLCKFGVRLQICIKNSTLLTCFDQNFM